MRVLTVRSRIYINCTVDGSTFIRFTLFCSTFPLYFVLGSLSGVAFCITNTLKMKVSGSIAGVAYVSS